MEIARSPFYVFDLDEAAGLLAFFWTEKSAEMSDDDYMAALREYAQKTVRYRIRRCLVDVRTFKHSIGEELAPWWYREIVPLYHLAGVEKFAFVVPGDTDADAVRVDPGTEFQTRSFASPAAARAWLTAVP